MALNERLSRMLQERGAPYELLPHREVFTAQEVAHSTHVPGRRLAKVVVLREPNGSYLMAVLPAPEHVDVSTIERATGRKGLALANEEEIRQLFPDCERGAMPPFGNLYGLSMMVDPCLQGDDIYFQAGNHHEVVRMAFDRYAELARPYTGDACLHAQTARVT